MPNVINFLKIKQKIKCIGEPNIEFTKQGNKILRNIELKKNN